MPGGLKPYDPPKTHSHERRARGVPDPPHRRQRISVGRRAEVSLLNDLGFGPFSKIVIPSRGLLDAFWLVDF